MVQGHRHELSQHQHWEIIYLKKNQHLSNCAIARRVKCNEGTVQAILKKEALYGHVDDLPRTGHPSKLQKCQRAYFAQLVCKHCSATGKDLATFVKQRLRIKITEQTAQKLRRKLGFHPHSKKKRTRLTWADKLFRLQWCHQRRSYSWGKAVFMDITTVRSSEACGHIWARKGEEVSEEWLEGPAHGPQSFVLGGISRQGTCGIALFNKKLNGEGYKDLLAEYILPAV